MLLIEFKQQIARIGVITNSFKKEFVSTDFKSLIKETLPYVKELKIQEIGLTIGPGDKKKLQESFQYAKIIQSYYNISHLYMLNHLEAHVLDENIQFPYISFLATSQVTDFYLCHDFMNYELLGLCIGENLGKLLEKWNKETLDQEIELDNEIFEKIVNPNVPGLDFFFQSYFYNAQFNNYPPKYFLSAVIKQIQLKIQRVVEQTQIRRVLFCGGVAANLNLQKYLKQFCESNLIDLVFPKYCTDSIFMTENLLNQYKLRNKVPEAPQEPCFNLTLGNQNKLII